MSVEETLIPRLAAVRWEQVPREAVIAVAQLVAVLARERLARALCPPAAAPESDWHSYARCAVFVSTGGGGAGGGRGIHGGEESVPALLHDVIGGVRRARRACGSGGDDDEAEQSPYSHQRWVEQVSRLQPTYHRFEVVATELGLPLDLFAPADDAAASAADAADAAQTPCAAALAHTRLLATHGALLIASAAMRRCCRVPAASTGGGSSSGGGRLLAAAQAAVLHVLRDGVEVYDAQVRQALRQAAGQAASDIGGCGGGGSSAVVGRQRLFGAARLLAQAQELRSACTAATSAMSGSFARRDAALIVEVIAALSADAVAALSHLADASTGKVRAQARIEEARLCLAVASGGAAALGVDDLRSRLLDTAAAAVLEVLGAADAVSSGVSGFAVRASACLAQLGACDATVAAATLVDDKLLLAVAVCAALLAELDAGVAVAEDVLATSLALAHL